MKITRRTQLLVVALVLCFTTMIGSTFAWFTDSVEVNGNKIESGTLKLEVLYQEGDKWKDLEKKADPLFNYSLWEPGYTVVQGIEIKNTGTLALKYKLNFELTKESTGDYKLEDVIDVYLFSEYPDRNAFVDSAKVGTLANLIYTEDDDGTVHGKLTGTGAPETATTGQIYIGLKMRETAGNEYQGLNVGEGFNLVVVATQDTVESDSFDNQYDADAEYIELPVADMEELENLNVELSDLLHTLAGVPESMRNGTNMKLDCGLVFTATQTSEEIVGKPYENWNADFTVTTNKSITAADCENGIVPIVLVGQYTSFAEDWIPIPVTADDSFSVEAGEHYRLLTLAGSPWSYKAVLDSVQVFKCGIKADPSWAQPGTQVIVELRVYEVVDNEETGKSYPVRTYTYTY